MRLFGMLSRAHSAVCFQILFLFNINIDVDVYFDARV